jgi:hypothetical protein
MEIVKVKHRHVRSFGIVVLKYRDLLQIEIHFGKKTIIIGF